MKKLLIVLLFALKFCIANGQVSEIEVTPEISDVIIYNSSVEIIYTKEIQLLKGVNKICFVNLTPQIVENTLNISASDKHIEINTVTERLNYIKKRKDIDIKISNIEDSIKYLTNSIGLLKCKYEALIAEKNLLFKDESIGGVSKGVAVAEIEKASMFFNKRYSELTIEIFKINNTITKQNDDLNNFEKQLTELTSNTMKATSEILVTVVSGGATKTTFTIKHLSPMGGWAPSYDIKYTNSTQPLKFHFRVNVFNSTGVSWDNVNMVLSTASPTMGFSKPSLEPSSKDNEEKNEEKRNRNDDGVEFQTIEIPYSIAEYKINGKYTIPSDSKPYLIDVESYEINADFAYLIIPKLDPFGFLIASIPGWNKYNLIPGKTNVYNNGSYMGKTFLNTYTENDTLKVFLGKDNSILSTKKEQNISSENFLIGNYYIEKSDVEISVKNNTENDLKIQILDQVPIFDPDDKVKFNINGIENSIYEKSEGLITWNMKLLKKSTINLNYKFEIKTPKSERGSIGRSKKKSFRTISCPTF